VANYELTTFAATETESATTPAQQHGGDPTARSPRVLFCAWTELDVASGTPVILCDLFDHFPADCAEVIVQENPDTKKRRQIKVDHAIHKFRFQSWLWPFSRGHRIRSQLAKLGVPFLIAKICRRVRRFRPDCILAVYAQPHWILATWIASRLTRVPLVYYVHDTFLDQTEKRKGSKFAAWLERKSLRAATVLVLHPSLADYYQKQYGIEAIVLRQMIRHSAMPARLPSPDLGERTIGFSGAIYGNNRQQLIELVGIVQCNPRLKLKIWTDASIEELRRSGICGDRVEFGYESNHERLLTQLSECDLLYLPLAFFDSSSVTIESLQYAFPTKSLDYLVSGVPILVHCPANFELSRFFAGHNCGYVLNDKEPSAVAGWLNKWLDDETAPLDDSQRRHALRVFSPEENKRLLWEVITRCRRDWRDAGRGIRHREDGLNVAD
jgi:glycosyltransferase involved in cell wall biosynthesis